MPVRAGGGRRIQRWVGIAAALASFALIALTSGYQPRLPVPWALVVVAFIASTVAAGFLIRGWWCLALSLLAVPAVLVAARIADNVLLVLEVIGLLPVSLGLLAAGAALRRAAERRGRSNPAGAAWTGAGAAIAALALLPLPIALIQRERTVRAKGPRPEKIDERRGAYRGVRLGDSATKARARLGQPRDWHEDDPVSPLDADRDAAPAPGNPSTPPNRRDDFLRYPKASLWINGGRVWSIDIIDGRARTRRGVGVGDSLSLARDAYPGLRCGEGDSGSDEPIPFPFCTGRAGPHSYIYFSADYTKPGEPIAYITLARGPIS